MTITGSCLCGAVKYEINGKLIDAGNCHCTMCRKIHGSAFATYADIEPSHFRWVSGEDLVSFYEASPNASRVFCSVCGSTLGGTEDTSITSITLGTVDGNPGIKPRSHIFVGSMAPWHKITDDLPRFEEQPPGDEWA